MWVQIVTYFILTFGVHITLCSASDGTYDYYEDDSEMCGGSVAVSGSMELSYENPGESGDERTCIWGLYTPQGVAIGITLLDHKFGKTIDGRCSSLSLHTDFNGSPTSTAVSIQAQDRGIERSTRLRDSVLVFTSTGGQSFRLRLRPISMGSTQGVSGYSMGRPISTSSTTTNVTVHTFWPQSTPQEKQFSYPSIPGASYENGEVRMLIFGSVPRYKVSISVDFVDTEPGHDILSAYKYLKENRRFLIVQRLHGHHGNFINSSIEGSENQPLFLRFQSDSSNSGGGFKLTYNYQIVNDEETAVAGKNGVTTKSMLTTIPPPVNFAPCSGFITVDNEETLAYKNNGSETVDQVCVWVIGATNGGLLGVTLMDQNFDNCNSSSAQLSLQIKPATEGAMMAHRIGSGNKGIEIVTQHGIVLLVFTSKGSGGRGGGGPFFQIKLRRLGSYNRLKDLKISGYILGGSVTSSANSFSFSYPTFPATRYEGHDRCQVIIKPIPGKVIHLTVNSVDTESGRDNLDVFSFAKSYNKFWLMQRFSGRLGTLSTPAFEGQENQPMALTFETDASDHGNGFSINFSYQPAPDPSTIITRRGQETFDPCRSIVSVPGKSELAYRNPGGSEGNMTCVWVISASASGIGITLTEVYGSDETSFGSLSVHSGFGLQPYQFVQQVIVLADLGMEQVIPRAATVVIFTSSTQGQGFRLRLRDYSQIQAMTPGPRRNSLMASVIERASNDNPRLFSYPTSGSYPNNDDQLFVFHSVPSKKIRLEFKYLDTEGDHDHLTVYKFSKMDKILIPLQRLSGRVSSNVNATFEGDENQPVFIYFRSDVSSIGLGFKLNYAYQFAKPESLTTTTTTTKRTPRRWANRTRKLNVLKPNDDGSLQTAQSVSVPISTGDGHTALFVGLGLAFVVVACGALYALFCSGRPLVKDQQCMGITSIFSSCPALPGQSGGSTHPVPRTSGRQRLRSLQEDENF